MTQTQLVMKMQDLAVNGASETGVVAVVATALTVKLVQKIKLMKITTQKIQIHQTL